MQYLGASGSERAERERRTSAEVAKDNAYTWKVVPVCGAQRLDVREEDLLEDGDFRNCNVGRSGDGQDRFPSICKSRLGEYLASHFVVQLYGCPLSCWYCYVTREGIWGRWKEYTTDRLVEVFSSSGQKVFHLMGGAPALYMEQWPKLIEALPAGCVFHSDMLLIEKAYRRETLRKISGSQCLYAVGLKGTSAEDYEHNTGVRLDSELLWRNLRLLVEERVPFYLTFTNPDTNELPSLKDRLAANFGPEILRDSFVLDVIQYKSLRY